MGIIPTSKIESIDYEGLTHGELYVKNMKKGDHNDRPCVEFIEFLFALRNASQGEHYFLATANSCISGSKTLTLSWLRLVIRPGKNLSR